MRRAPADAHASCHSVNLWRRPQAYDAQHHHGLSDAEHASGEFPRGAARTLFPRMDGRFEKGFGGEMAIHLCGESVAASLHDADEQRGCARAAETIQAPQHHLPQRQRLHGRLHRRGVRNAAYHADLHPQAYRRHHPEGCRPIVEEPDAATGRRPLRRVDVRGMDHAQQLLRPDGEPRAGIQFARHPHPPHPPSRQQQEHRLSWRTRGRHSAHGHPRNPQPRLRKRHHALRQRRDATQEHIAHLVHTPFPTRGQRDDHLQAPAEPLRLLLLSAPPTS